MDDKEKEIINIYSKYYTPDDLDKMLIETYINSLKKCRDMGNHQLSTQQRSKRDFEESFTKLVQMKNSNYNNIAIICEEVFREILVIIDLLGQSYRVEDRVASITAYEIVIDKIENKELQVL